MVEPIPVGMELKGVDDSGCCHHPSCVSLHQARLWCKRWYVLRWIADYEITFCMVAARLETALAPRGYAYWGKLFDPSDGDDGWVVEILLDMDPAGNTSGRRSFSLEEATSLKKRVKPRPGQPAHSFVAELYAFPCCGPGQKHDFGDWTNLVVRDHKREFWGANHRDLVNVFEEDVKSSGLVFQRRNAEETSAAT